MKLEHLFICRHGDYDRRPKDPGLNDQGKRQAEFLGNKIAEIIEEMPRAVVSSVSKRAKETAAIIAQVLGVSVQEAEALWHDAYHEGNLTESLKLITTQDVPAVIAVTHERCTGWLPYLYAERVLNAKISTKDLAYGEAWHLKGSMPCVKHVKSDMQME